MEKWFKAKVENADQSDTSVAVPQQQAAAEATQKAARPAAERALRLKAAQDKAAQYLREQRYEEARRALNKVKNIQAEEVNSQRQAEAQAEREKALILTNEGKYAEAGQALARADELEALVAGWKARPKRFFRSRVLECPKFGRKDQTECAE